MSGTCVIGLQWGDEAKGKLVDLLTADADVVVRYQGGANAGHTVVDGENVYKLHHVPSGILSPHATSVIGPGVVVNPATILGEIDKLENAGVDVGDRLMLSDRAHVVCPWHFEEDRALDSDTADGENIGTTMRGIGPCYRDKVGRSYAIRLGDMYRDGFRETVATIAKAKNRMFAGLMETGEPPQLDADAIYREYSGYAERLRPHVADTTAFLLDSLEAGKRLLFEGAQGALLDVDHGTYPFVTSSNSSGVGISAGSGVPGCWITKIYGVLKAYCTRVGGGPFPTELENETGNHIREEGNEYGTTTGRPRRCGWFDAVAARYTARLSGVDVLSIMMIDVLSKLPEIRICVAYEIDGRRVEQFPSHIDDVRKAVPVFETLPGWQVDVTGVRRIEDLPANVRAYLDRVSQLVGRPVAVVSVGPDRKETMFAE